MSPLVVAVTLIGLGSAYPQSFRNIALHEPVGSKVAYEYHDVHQSPVPAIRQTQVQSDYQVPAQPYHVRPAARSSGPVHPPIAILSMNQEATFDGNFNYGFQSEDGIQTRASGTVRAIEGSEFPAQVMRGSYSYVAPDGTQVVTNWYADETGFHAEGDHIPAVPEAIQRSVEYLRSLPPAQQQGQHYDTRQ